MQFEWLDAPHFSRCMVTRKGQSAVVRAKSGYYDDEWLFDATGRYVGWWLSFRLNRRHRRKLDQVWKDQEWIPALPKAQVVKSSP